MDKYQIKVGADPEVFIRNTVHSRGLIPSTGIIGGTKKEPIPIPGLAPGFTMQEDNVMCEFNIPPAQSKEEFDAAISLAMQQIGKILPKNMELVVQASGIFKPKHLKTKEATTFGCDPDINAWTGSPNTFVPADDPCLRCCGGHVHVGLPSEQRSYGNDVSVIRAMDLFLGLPSILVDNDTRRKEMYGKAGAFRPKPYGVEYRVLSNFWTATPALRQWVFEATSNAVNFAYDKTNQEKLEVLRKDIVLAINTQNADRAEKLCRQFDVEIP